MTAKEPIEEKLENLGRAISSDDSLVENVMSRIDTEVAQLHRIKNLKNKLTLRRFIMNRFTKLTAAAVIIIAVVLAITFLDKTVTPAYAIEQTVEAFKNVRFMHIIRHDETGQVEDERWIEIGPDGTQARYRQDSLNILVVDSCENIFVHHKDKNTVLLYGPDGQRYTWISNPRDFFKDLTGEGSVTIKENVDYWGIPAHQVRWLKTNLDCYIHSETKLPIAMGGYDISYEGPLEGIFDIPDVPEGVIFLDKRPGAEATEEPEWMGNEEVAQQKFNEARKALVAREYEKAIELFKKVVEIQPRRNWALFWLGQANYKLSEYNAAIHEFSKVIDMFSKFNISPHYCYLARGFAYQAKGMEEMARRDFDIALPVMVDALKHIEAASLFDFADDPLLLGGGLQEGHKKPGKEQSLAMMVNRLRIITGQNFGYNPDAAPEENEQAIAAWETWFENSGEIRFTPNAELVPVPGASRLTEK
ncbi:MAG: tetratricopeptide repeat protein [Planctomycetota bacterium]|jgi:hypothetical protein